MAKKTFEIFDKIGLKDFAGNFYNALQIESSLIDESLVISLNGKFGCGKSSFFEMFQYYLEATGKEVISINAWKNDFFSDPVIAIAAELIEYFEEKDDNKNTKILIDTLYEVSGYAIAGANQIGKQFTTVDFIEIIEKIIKEKKVVKNVITPKKIGEKSFQEYKERKEIFETLNSNLGKYLDEKKELVILVDELDRCRPDYAVSFIETLKHFFNNKGISFILGIDREIFQSSVHSIYGISDKNFDEYFRKFVHRNINFPENTILATNSYIEFKLEEIGIFKKEDIFNKELIINLCHNFKLSLRQINEFLRIVAYYIKSKANLPQDEKCAAILYASIKFADKSFAQKIKEKDIGGSQMYGFLYKFFNDILFQGSFMSRANHTNEYIESYMNSMQRHCERICNAEGRGSEAFLISRIAKEIDELNYIINYTKTTTIGQF